MRRAIFFAILLPILAARPVRAQDSLAVALLKSLRGTVAPFSGVQKKDSLFLICFWENNTSVSIGQLDALNTQWEQWRKTVPFRLLAVCTDQGKLANRVRPTAIMNAWTFEVYTDINGSLRRALQANNMPMAIVLWKNKVYYQQSGYTEGSEKYLFEKLRQVGGLK